MHTHGNGNEASTQYTSYLGPDCITGVALSVDRLGALLDDRRTGVDGTAGVAGSIDASTPKLRTRKLVNRKYSCTRQSQHMLAH